MLDYFSSYPLAVTALAMSALVLAAFFANFVVKLVLVRGLHRVLSAERFGWDESIRDQQVIPRLSNAVPALVMAHGVAMVPGLPEAVAAVVRNVANATTVLMIALAFSAAINVVDTIYHRRDLGRSRSIKGYLQILKLAAFAIAGVFMAAVIVDRSPVILLSGLGAMAAVLMLIFQDTLLSLVASIQISSSDMLRVNDWITVPGMHADGDVIEIALHTVKVQNWDMTITTIPTRKLISDPFINWRGMQESGGRRIKRAIRLDQSSIRFLDDGEIRHLGSVGLIADYVEKRSSEIAEWNAKQGDGSGPQANYRRMTNLGTFREYVAAYLRNHPELTPYMTQIARPLQPDAQGLPFEVYCFTRTKAWVEHERIQADIFDHLYAILPEFGLRAFQVPTGHDFASLAMPRPDNTNVRLVA